MEQIQREVSLVDLFGTLKEALKYVIVMDVPAIIIQDDHDTKKVLVARPQRFESKEEVVGYIKGLSVCCKVYFYNLIEYIDKEDYFIPFKTWYILSYEWKKI
jgi:hypothetical protein